MKLFILRHGEAEARAKSDAERSLTARGEQCTRAVISRHCDQRGRQSLDEVQRVIASPYRRAQQTAVIANAYLECPLLTSPLLTPDAGLQPLLRWLQEETSTPLLVSHQPLVGNLVDWLTGAARGRYSLATSTLVCLEAEVWARACAELVWIDHGDH